MKDKELITIDGLDAMSKQELFDMSARHILKTRTKSTGTFPNSGNGGCIYSGSGCGASVFLKPEFHQSADGVGSWMALEHMSSDYFLKISHHECRFISELQSCHDRASNDTSLFMEEWERSMINMAHRYNLNLDVFKGEDASNVSQ